MESLVLYICCSSSQSVTQSGETVSNPVPKLILHSNQSLALTGDRDAELLKSLSGKKLPKILYLPSIRNARRSAFEETMAYYSKLGFTDVQIFEPEEGSREVHSIAMRRADVVHLSGGDVIPFSRRLKETGCDELLKEFLTRGGVVLGVSAGAMILSPSFKTARLYRERGEFCGLGLIDFEIIPHASESFPRQDLIEKFAREEGIPIYAMNDGDIIVVHGKKLRTYGSPILHGSKF
jgi:dipeptidase E